MTEGSKFPEGVEVHQRDLLRTEATKSAAVRDRMTEAMLAKSEGGTAAVDFFAYRGGRVPGGLVVSLNSGDNTLIDISAGSGYAPNGERIVVAASQLAVPLSDYTDGLNNLVCLVYTETAQTLQPHETDGTSRNTECVSGFRVAVLTQAEFDALPATFEDTSQNAQDRILVVAEVLGNGLTSGIPNNLVSGEISREGTPTIITAVDWTTTAIPGVQLVDVQHATNVDLHSGIGTLTLTVTSDAVKNITYAAPGESAGSAVNVVAGGSFVVFSTSGTNFILVRVRADALPIAAAGSTVGQVTVTRLYEPAGPNLSGADLRHRHLTGGNALGRSTALNSQNPHGIDLDAMGSAQTYAGTVEYTHNNTTDDDVASRPTQTTVVADDAGVQRSCIWKFRPSASNNAAIRFFLTDTGRDFNLEITYNADWRPDLTNMWHKDQTGVDAYRYEFGRNGSIPLIVGRRNSDADWSEDAFETLIQAGNASSAATPILDLSGTLFDTASEATIPRLQINGIALASGYRTLLFQSADDIGGGGEAHHLRIYHVRGTTASSLTASGTLENALEITFNAGYTNAAGSPWASDVTSRGSVKVEVDEGGVNFFSKLATASAWADSAWDGGALVWNALTNSLTMSGGTGDDMLVDGDFSWTAPRAMSCSMNASDAVGYSIVGTNGIIFGSSDPEGARVVIRHGTGATDQAYIVPIHLPDGALVTACTLTFESVTNGSGQLRVAVLRQPLTTGLPESLRAGTAYDVPGDNAAQHTYGMTINETSAIRTIDNGSYAYYLWVFHTAGGASEHDWSAAEVFYTLQTPLPTG